KAIPGAAADGPGLLDHGLGFRPEFGEDFLQVVGDALSFLGVKAGPAVLTTDAVAAAAKSAVKLGFGLIQYRQGTYHTRGTSSDSRTQPIDNTDGKKRRN